MNRESLMSAFAGARTLLDITDKIKELKTSIKRKKAQSQENGILAQNKAQTVWKIDETQKLIEAIHDHGKDLDKLTAVFNGTRTKQEVTERAQRLIQKLPNLKEAFVTKK